MENEIIVEGYSFSNKKLADQARTEAEGVRYVKSRADLSKPDQVFQVYHKLLDQRMFRTPVGYQYLKELQEYLKTMPGIHKEDIRPIPVETTMIVRDSSDATRQWKRRLDRVQDRLRISGIVNLVLAVAILAMFVIALTSNQTNVLNYENQIQDKYASWEQQLEEREKRVREREIQLQLDDWEEDSGDSMEETEQAEDSGDSMEETEQEEGGDQTWIN